MKFRKIIFDFDHTLVEFGPHMDWRSAIRQIEKICVQEGIPTVVLQQSKGVGFKLMRTVYDHMRGVKTVLYRSKMNPVTERNFTVFPVLDGIATLATHIPNKGEQLVRYYGYYSNVSRGKRKKENQVI